MGILKTDYLIAAMVGFLVGVFAVPTLINIGVKNYAILMGAPLAVPVVWVAGIWLGGFLSRFLPVMAQFSRFVAVGFLNTAIDFGILNLLSFSTGVTQGFQVGGINIPGFLAAVLNGYFWNKLWVFSKNQPSAGDSGNLLHDFPKFFAVSVGGLILNSGLVVILTSFDAPFGLDAKLWLNASKVAASALSLFWNFVGYKFIVFVSVKANTPVPGK